MKELNRFTQEHGLEIAQRILLAIQGIRYGSVEILIHDSQVVQIERKEKLRFDSGRTEDAMRSSNRL